MKRSHYILLVLIYLLSVACLAEPKQSHLPDLKHFIEPQIKLAPLKPIELAEVNELRIKLETEEQRCVDISHAPSQEHGINEQRQKLDQLGSSALPLLKRNKLFVEMPSGFNPNEWKDVNREAWEEKVLKLEASDRCQLLTLAYIYAVWQVSVLEPTHPIKGLKDIRYETLTEDIILDQKRASWPFRYLHFLPESNFPKACKDLKTETELRWQMIFHDKNRRKPLGFAKGMCGRTMNAHYK